MITQEEMNRIFPNIEKYTVGFNDYFEALNKTAEQYKNAISAYPPFNIKRTDANTYVIELAVAGFGKNELSSTFDYAGPLTETILMGNLALRSWNIKDSKGNFPGRKKLLWDATNMKITNFDEANQFVRRSYRPGYSFEL